MILYTIKFKKQNGIFNFWKTIKNCKGDGFSDNGLSRFIILDNEERIEIDIKDTIFNFSKERWMLIKERMSNEAGQEIRIDKR